MKRNQSVGLQKLKFDAQDRENMESGAKSCWNKFTRFVDKFTEIIFMLALCGHAIYSIVTMFVGAKKGFSI